MNNISVRKNQTVERAKNNRVGKTVERVATARICTAKLSREEIVGIQHFRLEIPKRQNTKTLDT